MSVRLAPSTQRRTAFHSLDVKEVRRLTPDAVEVAFHVPPELTGHFDYIPGQYVALRTELPDDEGQLQELRRSYSICVPPTSFEDGSSEIRVAVKRDIGGRFSAWANSELRAGDRLDVMSPMGAFTSKRHNVLTDLNHPENLEAARQGGNFVGVAAGSGITPVIAIARTLLAANPGTRVDLIYANKASMDVMFVEELADLKDRYPGRFGLYHVLSREQRIAPLLTGRIDAEKLERILDDVVHADDVDEWFLCGPFELVQLCRDVLAEKNVPEEQVRFELFSTGKPNEPAGHAGRPVKVSDDEESVELTFTLDGLENTVKSPVRANESILNAALRTRSDVPFACAGGVCGTCRAKLVSGTVTMSENYALEPDEVEAGYILTCQSHPTSEAVTVDYDG